MKKPFIAILLVAALLLTAFVAFWLNGNQGTAQIVRLSDGSELVLDEISFGTKHSYHFGSAWKRFLAALPPAISRRLGQKNSAMTLYSPNPSLAFWCHWENKLPQSPDIEFLLADENGFESKTESSSYSYSSTPTESIEGRAFSAFPRRGRVISVQVYEHNPGGGRKKQGSFTLRNPVRNSFPAWTAEPLPVTKKDGNFEVTLVRLVTGVDSQGKKIISSPENAVEPWTMAGFRVLEKNRPATNWTPVNLEMSDATGNKLNSSSWSSSTRGNEKQFCYRWTLWPDGTPWKIRAEFSRESGFSENELCTFEGIPVPPSGGFFQTNLEARVLNEIIRLHGVTSDGGILPGNFTYWSGSSAIHVAVKPSPGLRLTLVKVTDNTGRTTEMTGSGSSEGLHSYGVKFPPGARTIDITFALHKSRFLEFIVLPEDARK